MSLPPIVEPTEWHAARQELLIKEKAATRMLDELAAERRRLPIVRFGTDYSFAGPDGTASLRDLFAGRRQLLLYQMRAPACALSPGGSGSRVAIIGVR